MYQFKRIFFISRKFYEMNSFIYRIAYICDNSDLFYTFLILYKLGKSESQVALRWLLQKDIVPSVIIGCTSLKQMEENCAAASGWKLTKEQVIKSSYV